MNKEKQDTTTEETVADNTAENADVTSAVESDSVEDQLAAALQEVQEHKDNYLRAVAELENTRRRSEKKVAEAHQYGLTDFALAVGEVRDCLEAALHSASEQHYDKLHEGVSLTLRKLVSAMDARHILPIMPDIGATFDPSIHMAIGKLPASKQAADGSVAAVIQSGYMLHGRVIRAANVMVAETPDEEEQAAASAKSKKKKK